MASYLRLVLCAFFNVDFNIDPFCAFGSFFVYFLLLLVYAQDHTNCFMYCSESTPTPWNGLKEISGKLFIITSLPMCESDSPLASWELVKAVLFLTHKLPGWSIWGSGPTPSLIHLPKTFNLSILSPLWWKCTKHLISHSFKGIVGLKRRGKKTPKNRCSFSPAHLPPT